MSRRRKTPRRGSARGRHTPGAHKFTSAHNDDQIVADLATIILAARLQIEEMGNLALDTGEPVAGELAFLGDVVIVPDTVEISAFASGLDLPRTLRMRRDDERVISLYMLDSKDAA